MKKAPRPAHPFVKWAGGKTRILGEILPALPRRFATYYEPFTGGGAVFFALAYEGRFERAVLGDRNGELINAYLMVRDHCDALLEHLRYAAAFALDESYYHALRARAPRGLSRLERAARLIFLNRTSFNGLWRENASGAFNTSFGRYRRPRICDEANLRAVSAVLQGVELVAGDFRALSRRAGVGDAIYFDPPYVPTAATSFVAYQARGFGPRDHRRVAAEYRAALARGAVAVLSNSAAAERLYRGLEARHVEAPRRIAARADRREPVLELLVTGAKAASR